MKEVISALAFSFKKGMGGKRCKELVERFGNFSQALELSGMELSEEVEKAYEELEKASKLGVSIIPMTSPNYPPFLKEIDSPPPVLYVRGNLQGSIPSVSIVGSRRCSEYGRRVAHSLASFLVENGVVVVSGLAYGIDASAHKGAVEAGGVTWAVLGSGVDVIAPVGNRCLAKRILETGGCLISEFPLGTKGSKESYPRRNRIVSGLSVALVVVEARERSGTSITVGYALEQGRHVFAVPGNIDSPFSKGTNRLIKAGAIPLVDFEDIFEEIPILKKVSTKPERVNDPILEALKEAPLSIDELLEKTGISMGELLKRLMELEIKGLVKKEGLRYAKC